MDLLAEMAAGRWHPGIGDPTPMGWFTVAAYFATGVLCWSWGRRVHRQSGGAGDRLFLFCYGLAVLLFLLGVNKQLDLQTWFTQTGKDLARAHGWYEQRRLVQKVFIAVLGAAAVGFLIFCVFWTRAHRRRFGPALVGMTLLVTFVAVRAASFHHVDEMLGWQLDDLKFNWILEIVSIGLVAAGALWGRAGTRDP